MSMERVPTGEVLADEDDPVMTLANLIKEWHEHKTSQLRLIVDNREAVLQLGAGPDPITLEGRDAKCFRAGIRVALEMIEKLPFELSTIDPDQDNEKPPSDT